MVKPLILNGYFMHYNMHNCILPRQCICVSYDSDRHRRPYTEWNE